jgi:hypothetical protein
MFCGIEFSQKGSALASPFFSSYHVVTLFRPSGPFGPIRPHLHPHTKTCMVSRRSDGVSMVVKFGEVLDQVVRRVLLCCVRRG